MTAVVYLGPSDEVELAGYALLCAQGQPVDVPDELAGRPPSGEPGEASYDPGEGLLAQTSTWAGAGSEPARRAAEVRDSAAVTLGADDGGGSASSGIPAVRTVLAEVGADREKAAAALAVEEARGDKARPTLVKELRKLLGEESTQ